MADSIVEGWFVEAMADFHRVQEQNQVLKEQNEALIARHEAWIAHYEALRARDGAGANAPVGPGGEPYHWESRVENWSRRYAPILLLAGIFLLSEVVRLHVRGHHLARVRQDLARVERNQKDASAVICLGKPSVEQVQRKLRTLGLYSGEIDGIPGDGTWNGLRQYGETQGGSWDQMSTCGKIRTFLESTSKKKSREPGKLSRSLPQETRGSDPTPMGRPVAPRLPA